MILHGVQKLHIIEQMSQNNGYSLSVDTDICSAIVVVFLLLLLLFLYHSVEENLVLNE